MGDRPWGAINQVDQTLITTGETGVVSVACKGLRQGQFVIIIAWAQLLLGTNTTTVTGRLSRVVSPLGARVGAVFNDIIAEAIKTAAGSTEPFFMMAAMNADVDDPIIGFTLQQTGASANGTAHQAGILVFEAAVG